MEKRKRFRKITCYICLCFLLASNTLIVNAEALPSVLAGDATVADAVMSYYAMSGAAVANTDWINSLYDSLGSSFGTVYDFAENGMLTLNQDGTWYATSELTQAVQDAAAYTNLGLNEVFNISAEEAASGGGLAASSGASILSGAMGGLASNGVLPLLGGVTAAYWGGIALGTLANHIADKYDENIYAGVQIDVLNKLVKTVGSRGFSFSYNESVNGVNRYRVSAGFGVGDVFSFAILNPDINVLTFYLFNNDSKSVSGTVYSYLNDRLNSSMNFSISSKSYWNYSNGLNLNSNPFISVGVIIRNSEFNSYLDKWKSGVDIPVIKSPDLIGANGNQTSSYDPDSGYSVPDIKPYIDPGTQAGKALSMSDWLNFANAVKNNNSNSDPFSDNARAFEDLMRAIVENRGNIDPDPNPNPDPWKPPVVTPSPDPDYDPVPDNPNQPDYESEKQNQTEKVPDSIPTGAPWTTDKLLDKFPFCIPKDLIDMVKNFSSGSRQAPYISWRFNPPHTPVDYTFNLDLSDFEEAATLLRLLELAAFVVGLAFGTRYLIGAS